MLDDTHYGPIDRAGWSERVAAAVNALDADVVVRAGDIADGTATRPSSCWTTAMGFLSRTIHGHAPSSRTVMERNLAKEIDQVVTWTRA
ncbi:hypothetical protein ACIGXM_02600 [Kitasatospora sp. NPDC052896]|uniref:hypothetical protein n=1 Tax=Kitasatospora sp. NPDC052896 TaxID=3364061 RepID=UPI0037CA248A